MNPEVTATTDDTFLNNEGCLSVPNLRGRVQRSLSVRVQGWDRHGNDIDLVARGISAGTYQHEVDHLHATLFIDRVTDPRSLCTWQEFERQHRAQFIEEAQAIVAKWGS